jgi:hypothetical protein
MQEDKHMDSTNEYPTAAHDQPTALKNQVGRTKERRSVLLLLFGLRTPQLPWSPTLLWQVPSDLPTRVTVL